MIIDISPKIHTARYGLFTYPAILKSCITIQIFLALLISLVIMSARAQNAYEIEWARNITTTESDRGNAVTTDSSGNAFLAGDTWGDVGGSNAGQDDAYLTKFSPSGEIIWSSQYGSNNSDYAHAVATDANKNVYVSGYDRASFHSSFVTRLVKYDPDGRLLWSKHFNTGNTDTNRTLAVDDTGHAYIAFNGGSTINLLKVDPNGNELWRKRNFRSGSTDYSDAIAIDHENNIYVTGRTLGDLAGPHIGGYEDAFLSKFNANGDFLWARQIGTSAGDRATSVAVDHLGNAFITGRTFGDLDGPNSGNGDAFVMKFDRDGHEQWVQQFGTPMEDSGLSITIDSLGNAYLTGTTTGNLFGANGTFSSYAVFVSKIDPKGQFIWSDQFDHPNGGIPESIALDRSGNIYLGGTGLYGLGDPSLGSLDAFILKLKAQLPGDSDGDGDIDDTDLGIAISHFTGPIEAAGGKTAAQGDSDGDGDVDDTDLGIVISGFTGPLAALVPEPSTLALLGLAGLLTVRRRKRVWCQPASHNPH